MNEEMFIKRAHKLLSRIRYDRDTCEDMTGGVKALYLLCHNWLELKKMEKDTNNENKIDR